MQEKQRQWRKKPLKRQPSPVYAGKKRSKAKAPGKTQFIQQTHNKRLKTKHKQFHFFNWTISNVSE